MKRSIEKLVIWLIPAELLGVILRGCFDYFSAERLIDPSYRTFAATFSMLSGFSYILGYIVISIWLFHQKHESRTRRWVWCIFGVSSGFWALGIYLLASTPEILSQFKSIQSNTDPSQNA